MNRSSRLSPRDLEQLSAYLDGALAGGVRAALEARLKEDAELRLALEELRSVAQALRRLPTMPLRRSFVLRSDAIPSRRRARYPAMTLATGLATVAFLAVFGWDTLAQSGFSLGAQAPMLEEPEAESLALEAQAPEGGAFDSQPPSAIEETAGATPSAIDSLRAAAPEPTQCPGCPSPTNAEPEEFGDDYSEFAFVTATPPSTPTSMPTADGDSSEKTAPLPDLVDSLKISLGILAAGLFGATIYLRRRRPWPK
jgi:hypothetical protein